MDSAKIIYEDNHIAAVSKDTGEDCETFFTSFYKNKKYVHPVNRLDKPVSGIMVLAFSPFANAKLAECFKSGKVKKEYWAVCEKKAGGEETEKGVLHKCEDLIAFNGKSRKAFICKEGGDVKTAKNAKIAEAAKAAKLFWVLKEAGVNYNFVKVFPVTGRTHQIRLQLSKAGMPIKGDLKYGARRSEKNGGIRLHSYAISFFHPQTGREMFFSVLPQKRDSLWQACIKACGSAEFLNEENQNG